MKTLEFKELFNYLLSLYHEPPYHDGFPLIEIKAKQQTTYHDSFRLRSYFLRL